MQALRDLADPAEGVYNATALLGDRLAFIGSMLDKYQKLPSRTAAPTPNMVAGMPVPAAAVEDDSAGIAGRLTGMSRLDLTGAVAAVKRVGSHTSTAAHAS